MSLEGSGPKVVLKRTLNSILTPRFFIPFWKSVRLTLRWIRTLKKESDEIVLLATKRGVQF